MNTYQLIIVGGGPAGITAGIYISRKQIKTLLLTKDFSGQAGRAIHIENYPGFRAISGRELMGLFSAHLKEQEIEIKEGEMVRKIKKQENDFLVETEKNQYLTKAIIIASGRNPRPLLVPGEKKFLGKGVSYCVTCDGPLFKGKTVAVIGGGNAGFNAALELARYCSYVYILEFRDRVIADEINQERVRATNKIAVITNARVKEIFGETLVKGLTYEDRSTKETKEIKVEGVFVEIGSVPATAFITDLVDFNQRGEIIIDPFTNETKTKGIFAAGDVTNIPYKQIIIACSEGAKAALSVYSYLQKKI